MHPVGLGCRIPGERAITCVQYFLYSLTKRWGTDPPSVGVGDSINQQKRSCTNESSKSPFAHPSLCRSLSRSRSPSCRGAAGSAPLLWHRGTPGHVFLSLSDESLLRQHTAAWCLPEPRRLGWSDRRGTERPSPTGSFSSSVTDLALACQKEARKPS